MNIFVGEFSLRFYLKKALIILSVVWVQTTSYCLCLGSLLGIRTLNPVSEVQGVAPSATGLGRKETGEEEQGGMRVAWWWWCLSLTVSPPSFSKSVSAFTHLESSEMKKSPGHSVRLLTRLANTKKLPSSVYDGDLNLLFQRQMTWVWCLLFNEAVNWLPSCFLSKWEGIRHYYSHFPALWCKSS